MTEIVKQFVDAAKEGRDLCCVCAFGEVTYPNDVIRQAVRADNTLDERVLERWCMGRSQMGAA